MTPASALRVPEKLIRFVQHLPVYFSIAGLELRWHGLLHDFANLAGFRIGFTQARLFVIARGGDEGEPGAVRAPLDVGPFGAAAGDVVAEGGTVLVGLDLEASDALAIEINDDALDGGHDVVAGQRIFP